MVFLFELGVKAKDQITGFTGIVTARCQHLYGCNTYGVTPQAKKGTFQESQWFDEGRLTVAGVGIKPAKVKVEKPGAGGNPVKSGRFK